MAKKHILVDKTELVLMVEQNNKFAVVNLTNEQISRIQIDTFKERRLFRQDDSEKISIFSRKSIEPYVFKKRKESAYWDEYKQKLTKFAQDNYLTFADNTAADSPASE